MVVFFNGAPKSIEISAAIFFAIFVAEFGQLFREKKIKAAICSQNLGRRYIWYGIYNIFFDLVSRAPLKKVA
jgi:hypothetical protein